MVLRYGLSSPSSIESWIGLFIPSFASAADKDHVLVARSTEQRLIASMSNNNDRSWDECLRHPGLKGLKFWEESFLAGVSTPNLPRLERVGWSFKALYHEHGDIRQGATVYVHLILIICSLLNCLIPSIMWTPPVRPPNSSKPVWCRILTNLKINAN